MVSTDKRLKTENQATRFVDDTAVYRRLGDAAAEYGVTKESIQKQIKGLAAEPLLGNNLCRYSKFVTFRDGSSVAQVVGSRRWEIW